MQKNIILPEPEDINPEMDDSQPAIPVIDMGIEGIIVRRRTRGKLSCRQKRA